MAKLKSLLPTLRERKRYIVFDILSQTTLDAKNVARAIDDALLKYGGSKAVAKAGLHFFKDKYENNRGIVRCAHTAVDEVKSALMLITHIEDKEAAFKSVLVSGMINKAQR